MWWSTEMQWSSGRLVRLFNRVLLDKSSSLAGAQLCGRNCNCWYWQVVKERWEVFGRVVVCLQEEGATTILPWWQPRWAKGQLLSSTSHWRDAKKPNREEKEKFKNNFSTFERRKRNPNSFASSREEKEKSRIFLPSFERKKRNLNSFLQFREEKEKSRIPLPSFEKRKRNWQIY